jgi:hypothetical protein
MKAGTLAAAARDPARDEPLPPELIPIVVPLLALAPALLMMFVFWVVL